MNQGGGLQRLPRRLSGNFLSGEPAQFLIDQGQELIGGMPVADPEWARSRGLGPSNAVDAARSVLARKLAVDIRPRLRPFYDMGNAPGMLPDLLGRYDLDGHGHALEADDDRLLDLQGAVRSLVSRAAKTAYRQGVDTVAPALRRLARL